MPIFVSIGSKKGTDTDCVLCATGQMPIFVSIGSDASQMEQYTFFKQSSS
jgi:hypothetical protein